MKKIIIYLVFLLIFSFSVTAQNHWYVTTTGTPAGDGKTKATAWDLQTALNHPSSVKEGDFIWMYGGVYKGHFASKLSGTETNWITISSYPNELATINGNIYPYVTPVTNFLNVTKLSIADKISSTKDIEAQSPAILNVLGGYVKYTNFEIACLGPINRIYEYNISADGKEENCAPNNGFHKMTGINHSQGINNTVALKNKFLNLIIRNIPGTGIGSWKGTSDTEINGCVIYFNGYIAYRRVGGCNTTPNHLGKGPGIYTQNSSGLKRLIKNNFIHNNYDSGILVWSATEEPESEYVKNYTIQDNVFLNNGSPDRDETSNLLVNTASNNQFNKPDGIDIFDNMFYINSRSSNVSGALIGNTKGVNFYNNNIYRGTTGNVLYSNNVGLNYYRNTYIGKKIAIDNPSIFSLENNNKFYNNKYYPNPNSSNGVAGEYKYGAAYITLGEIKNLYNQETNSYGYYDNLSESNCYFINAPGNAEDSSQTQLYYNSTCQNPDIPNKAKIIQNEYDKNKYYVSIYNSQNNSFPDVKVTFSEIPAGTKYKIRDVQNYFGALVGEGVLSNDKQIMFNLDNSNFESINGYYVVIPGNPLEHSHKDIGTYIVEFETCYIINNVTNNITESTAVVQKSSKYLSASNTVESIANVEYHAGETVVLADGFLSKSGSDFYANIKSCGLGMVQSKSSSNTNFAEFGTSSSETKEENFFVYPNPVVDGILNLSQIEDVNIYDVAGRLVAQKSNASSVDVSGLVKGVYIVKTSNGVSKQFIVE